ncbi:MAG: DeoR family transcriptional regulator [Anaerolineae bacterium]|jgi:biotin operon repressor|nr:DeoR family transcriptional regulator [Anaerolineae bacterium]MBT7190371.1 DeoR family transcriptional regulator [Anaerolineae bacterium]MBT7989191.1 DeoR family transcriptional regulator [Anaerolineae bacterium]
MSTAYQRQQKILDCLSERESCSIQELSELLSVSTMTIHRDLDKLADDGAVVKVHGGAILRPTTAPATEYASACPMCQQIVREQLAFVLQFDDESSKQACCPHCGLMMLNMQNPTLILATDFLHGNKVNALQATYLIKADLKTCCSPAVIAFASTEDAERFQQGFGGEMMNFSEAKSFLSSTHAPPRNM